VAPDLGLLPLGFISQNIFVLFSKEFSNLYISQILFKYLGNIWEVCVGVL